MITTVDVETSYQKTEAGGFDPSPFNPNNIQSREITGNGDSNTKKVCLVRLDLLKNYCYKIQTDLRSEEII